MIRLRHKVPCDDCPFRRDSMPGFLGGTRLADWITAWIGEAKFPCHKTISQMFVITETVGENHPSLDGASYCAGALTMMRNSCKSPRNSYDREAARKVEPDRETVFSHMGEFKSHHES